MIDWAGVGTGALWIVGLAVIFATLSHGHWLAHERGMRFRAVLGSSAYQVACDVGLALVSAGLFFSVQPLWQRIVWAAFALLYIAFGWVEWRREWTKTDPAPTTQPTISIEKGGQQPWGIWGAAKRPIATWLQRAELWLVLAAIPLLLFPGQYAPYALAAIALLWALRLVVTGRLTVRTSVDWPIVMLILMLPVTLWASADASMTRLALYRLLAGIALFYAVVNWVSTPWRLAIATALLVLTGVGIAAVAPLAATSWGSPKLFNALPFLARLPLRGKLLLSEDINANVLAGGLAIVWPVAASLLLARCGGSGLVPDAGRLVVRTLVRPGALKRLLQTCLPPLCLAAALLWMTAIFLLTQSRGAFLALGVAIAVMGTLRWPLLRWLVLLFCIVLILLLWRGGAQQLQHWADLLSTTGTVTSLAGRQEVWSRALYMIQDFPYTGIGLGTFDRVQPLLYPFFLHSGEAHHAHNLFLQVAVDLGLPGLIAYLALLLGTLYATCLAYSSPLSVGEGPGVRSTSPLSAGEGLGVRGNLALGLLGSQITWLVHGLLDAGVWASKLAFLPWLVFALAVTLDRSRQSRVGSAT